MEEQQADSHARNDEVERDEDCIKGTSKDIKSSTLAQCGIQLNFRHLQKRGVSKAPITALCTIWPACPLVSSLHYEILCSEERFQVLHL
jgi:hypothetical protein